MGFSAAIRHGLITTFPDYAEAVVADDDVTFEQASIIWVNEAANVEVVPWGGGASIVVTFAAPGAVPFRVQKIVEAGTTATDMFRIFATEET